MSLGVSVISAIVCTHNRSDLLPKAIKSLLDQTLDKSLYEIVVVDNGSTDGTRQVCDRFRESNNFRYVYEPELGLSISRNTGLREAKGKYVAYIDDDAIASLQWLEKILDAFENVRPSPACVGGKILPIWEIPKPDWFPDYKKTYLTILDYGDIPKFLEYPDILFGTNMAFKKDILLELKGFKRDMGRKGKLLNSNEEAYILLQIHKRNLPVFYHPDVSVSHLVPKERLNKKWLYRRQYWQGRSDAVLESMGLSTQVILKEKNKSILEIGLRLIQVFGKPFKHISIFPNISLIFYHYGKIVQLLLNLFKNKERRFLSL